MLILALDTALHAASACVADADRVRAARSMPMVHGHAEVLVPLMEEVLAEAAVEYRDLTRLAVTVGPGTFSGVRIALSAARAMGVALGIPVVGIGTLEALAAGTAARPCAAVIDARRGEVYLQRFGDVADTPRLTTVAAAAEALAPGMTLIGNGAPLLAALRPDLVVAGGPPAPEIADVARLAAGRDPSIHPPAPLYVRVPDAKPQGPPLERRP